MSDLNDPPPPEPARPLSDEEEAVLARLEADLAQDPAPEPRRARAAGGGDTAGPPAPHPAGAGRRGRRPGRGPGAQRRGRRRDRGGRARRSDRGLAVGPAGHGRLPVLIPGTVGAGQRRRVAAHPTGAEHREQRRGAAQHGQRRLDQQQPGREQRPASPRTCHRRCAARHRARSCGDLAGVRVGDARRRLPLRPGVPEGEPGVGRAREREDRRPHRRPLGRPDTGQGQEPDPEHDVAPRHRGPHAIAPTSSRIAITPQTVRNTEPSTTSVRSVRPIR